MPDSLLNRRELVVARFDPSIEALVAAIELGAELRQDWLEQERPGLQPSFAGLRWTESSLIVQALLVDSEVVTAATADGQRLWELGDTFEIFLGDPNSKAYSEFHVSPNGLKLALQFSGPDDVSKARKTGDLSPFAVPLEIFHAQAGSADSFPGWKVDCEVGGWYAFASIPAQAVTGRERIQSGEVWDGHFARYDYSSSGAEPILSSSAPLRALDFHRRHEWNRLIFQK
ncbi:MAG: hypothetical protein HZC36_02620 [Armatimonadetes bacterium]|nr:hypothetical protein [Armatimonadota bacterium]